MAKTKKDETEYLRKKYVVYEGMWKYAPSGKRVREKCIFTIIPQEKVYLRGIKYPFKHGRPYITPHHLIGDADNFDGECLAMDLEDIQILHNMIFNNAIDADMFNLPTFKQLRDDSGTNFDISGYYPGKVWEVDDMANIEMLGAGHSASQSIKLMQMAGRYGDDVSGVTELMTGRESSGDPKAPGNKTQMLMGESRKDLVEYLRNFMIGWNEVWWQACELFSQYGTGKKEFRVLNNDGESAFASAPDDLRVRPDMEPRNAEPIFSQRGKKAVALEMMERLQADPIVGPYVQMRPDLWMELWEEVGETSGPGISKILHKIQAFIQEVEQQKAAAAAEQQAQMDLQAQAQDAGMEEPYGGAMEPAAQGLQGVIG